MRLFIASPPSRSRPGGRGVRVAATQPAAQQRRDATGRDGQHDDLAERVDRAEVDEDDVDDVAAARLG
jgi:hypothetical protein